MIPAIADLYEPGTRNDSSDEAREWQDAEFAMSVSKISFHSAVTGPEKDKWRDAQRSEVSSRTTLSI